MSKYELLKHKFTQNTQTFEYEGGQKMRKKIVVFITSLLFFYPCIVLSENNYNTKIGILDKVEFHISNSYWRANVTILYFKDGSLFSYKGIPINCLIIGEQIKLKYILQGGDARKDDVECLK